MFKEIKKFFGPQLTEDLRSGINVPEGLAISQNYGNTSIETFNFSSSFGLVGDEILKDGESFPLFATPIDIAADAANATSIQQVVSIATNSLVNNQQLNRCEQPLPFEPVLYNSSFRRAVANSTTVSEAIQSCVTELNKIYLQITSDANRRTFELDGVASRNFPQGEYTYENDVNLSLAKGLIYGSSQNDENLNPITLQPVGTYQTVVPFGIFITPAPSKQKLVILYSDGSIRLFMRTFEKPPFSTSPILLMTLQLPAGKVFQGVVQGQGDGAEPIAPFVITYEDSLFFCNTTDNTIFQVVFTDGFNSAGTVISNNVIDTIANNNLPIIGIVNLKPQVMDILGITQFGTALLVIAEQTENDYHFNPIVAMSQAGGALSGWTYFPHQIRGICKNNPVDDGFGFPTITSSTIVYKDPSDSNSLLASRVNFTKYISGGFPTEDVTLLNFSAHGQWTFDHTLGTQSFSTVFIPFGDFSHGFPFVNQYLGPVANGHISAGIVTGHEMETRIAMLFDTSSYDDSRVNILKVRMTTDAIPFALNALTGAIIPGVTVEFYQFTTATPGVVANNDINTGVGALLGSFTIPYSSTGKTGSAVTPIHPPPDPDGITRGNWAFDFPVGSINTTGYTGIFIKLSGIPTLATSGSDDISIWNDGPRFMEFILTSSSDISSPTSTGFLANFPAEGTARYEERQFMGYLLDKQQEFVVPVKNVKQICNFEPGGLAPRQKVRTYNVEFPRFAYVNNSVAKTNNGSTYITDSYFSPYLTSGYSIKVGEFYDSRDGSTLTTKTKRLILTFDRLNYWYHSMRLIDGKCKLQMHIRSYTSRSIGVDGTITVISNPNAFSLLGYIGGTNPESGIKVINGGTVFKSLPRNMALDTDEDGIVTEQDLGRDYIVEWDVTDFIVSLRKTEKSSVGFIFRNANENQFFTLASGDQNIVGGEISSTVEIFDEYAPRLLFTDGLTGELFKKNGYRSASMPKLTASVVVT